MHFAQYYLDRNGDIYQVAEDTRTTDHTGSFAFGVNSGNSIGIELLNNVGEPYDGRMIAALIRLIDYLMVRYPSITRPERIGSNRVVRNFAGGDAVIAHSEHHPQKKCDPIGTFMSSQVKTFIAFKDQKCPVSSVPVAGGAAGAPSLMDIVVDAVAVLGRNKADTGVVNTSGGDALGVRTGGNGGDVTWRESPTSVAQRLGTSVQKQHTENSLLVVPQGTTRTGITGLQQFSDVIIEGTLEVSSALDLRVKGTVYLGPTGRIIVRNGFEGQNLAITTRGAPLVQGLIETAALEATSDQTGAAGGHVQVFAAAAGPHLIPTIITRGGDGDSADVVAGVGWGGNGGAVTIEIGDSHVFIGGGAGETGTPAMRTVADPNFLPPDHVGDFLPLPPPFNLGSIGLNRPATGQRVPLRKAASQLGFLRGILTSGGMGGTGIGGTTAQQAGAPGGAGGSFTLNTGSTGRITFRDVDLITGADVEMVISEIFVPDATSAIQLPYFAATGSLGGRGTIAGTSGGAGGAGGIAGAITVNGTLSPVPSSIDLVGGVQGDGAIIGFNSNGRPFQSDDPFTDFIIGTTVQASAGGKNLYRLRLDLSGNALGGSGGIPSGRASGFPGSFGPRGAGSPITGLPK
jgi:hypothetical protein